MVNFTSWPLYPPGKLATGTHCIGGWAGIGAGINIVEDRKMSCFCRVSNPGRKLKDESNSRDIIFQIGSKQLSPLLQLDDLHCLAVAIILSRVQYVCLTDRVHRTRKICYPVLLS